MRVRRSHRLATHGEMAVVASKEEPGRDVITWPCAPVARRVSVPARSLGLATTSVVLPRRGAVPASALPASGEVGEPAGPVAGSPGWWQNSQRQGEQGGKS